jgi:hypothetical protein
MSIGKTMSQKKETLILLLSLCLTLGAVGIGVKFLMPSPSGITQSSQNPGQQETDLRQRMSYGERSLIPSPTNIHKSVAIQAFAEGNFPGNVLDLWSTFLERCQRTNCNWSYPQIQNTTEHFSRTLSAHELQLVLSTDSEHYHQRRALALSRGAECARNGHPSA